MSHHNLPFFLSQRFSPKRWQNHTIHRVRQITFLLENALKKTTEYFLKFLFLFESTILPSLIMENNFIQMAASAGHVVAYIIGPIFEISKIFSC